MRKRKRSHAPALRPEVSTPAKATVPPDATVRFEVFHNGRRIARAGMPGYAVLTTTVTWVRRDVCRFPTGVNVAAEDLHFHVGGLDSNDPAWSRHTQWATPPLKLGDRIEIRISDNPRLDPPTAEQKYPNQKRPEPPGKNDPARTDIGGAILWPAPSGIYLRALDPDNGGPVVLSTRDATRMVAALNSVTADTRLPHARRKGRPRGH